MAPNLRSGTRLLYHALRPPRLCAWAERVSTASLAAALHLHAVSFDSDDAAAELPLIRFHDPRHTHATLALQAGVHPKVVSERLGHATVSITLDTYSHAIPAMEEVAAAKVAAVVFG